MPSRFMTSRQISVDCGWVQVCNEKYVIILQKLVKFSNFDVSDHHNVSTSTSNKAYYIGCIGLSCVLFIAYHVCFLLPPKANMAPLKLLRQCYHNYE